MSRLLLDTVGADKNAIAEYIRHQLDEDIAYEQLSFKEYIDPFTCSKNKKALTNRLWQVTEIHFGVTSLKVRKKLTDCFSSSL